jgi:hypothetical protein
MGFINTGGFLMGKNGLAFSKNCCCQALNCYCYTRYTNYGSTLVERRIVCYRAAVWNGSAWVFPDGQPCSPTKPSPACTVNFTGIIVKLCSCPGGGMNPFSWNIIETPAQRASCTTVSPAP